MKNIIYLTIFFCSSIILFGQQRSVHLLHGYGGQPDEWNNYDAWLESQNTIPAYSGISSHQIDYVNGAGLANGAAIESALFDGINENTGFAGMVQSDANLSPLNFSDPAGIAIGQSMGGLVLREMDNLHGGLAPFGGYITCGTPHQGLPMVNAMTATGTEPSEVEITIASWLETLAEGPYSSFLELGGDEYFIVSEFILNIFSDEDVELETDLAELITFPLRLIINQIDDPNMDIATGDALVDLPTGSNFINNINTFVTNKPTIGIWGNENQDAHYRIACAALSSPSEHPLYDDVDQSDYDGIKENTCINAMNAVAAVYDITADVHHVIADLSIFFGLFNLLADNDPAHWHSIGEAYERGADLLASQSELDYNALIQSDLEPNPTVTIEVPATQECFEPENFSGITALVDCYYSGNSSSGTVTTEAIGVGSSDGLVPGWSQQLPNAVANLEVESTNHFEYFNHPNMTARLDEILSLSSPVHPFFTTIP